MMVFTWWKVHEDRTAEPFLDSPKVSDAIDRACSPYEWFGTIEGCIKYGGVQANAIRRKIETTYDAGHWLATGAMRPTGRIVVTEVTAGPDGPRRYEKHWENKQ
jgi:hypothetical protein